MGVLVVLGQRRFLMIRSRRTPNQYSQPFINHAVIPPTGRPQPAASRRWATLTGGSQRSNSVNFQI
jgi:hypothetical protein